MFPKNIYLDYLVASYSLANDFGVFVDPNIGLCGGECTEDLFA